LSSLETRPDRLSRAQDGAFGRSRPSTNSNYDIRPFPAFKKKEIISHVMGNLPGQVFIYLQGLCRTLDLANVESRVRMRFVFETVLFFESEPRRSAQ
jgi:hypothetical protein